LRVIPLDQLRDKIPMSVAVAAVERGFKALAQGAAFLPEPMVGELPEQSAEIHVKGAYLTGARHIVIKVATGFPKNREHNLPSGDGLFLLLNAQTGVPELLLEEHGYLTDLRTAAAIALTLRYLAPQKPREALLLGAGAVARLTARAMIAERPLERLVIWNRSLERGQALVRELSGAVEARLAENLEPEVRRHRIIVTATSATQPLIRASWVQKGTHITSAGTGSPEKVELEPELLAKADKLIADRVAQTSRYGNLHHAIAAGVLTADRVHGELGDLAAGRRPGRQDEDEITIADLTGVGVQDAAIAQAAVEAIER
jgi:ornithine cyclodeaminase/alanine dehydrogenase-like protein (mu-crystallin family)